MSDRRPRWLDLLGVAVLILVGVAVWRLALAPASKGANAAHTSAATVKVVKEEDLGLVKLSEEGLQRLGVRVDPVERKSVRRIRVYGGEIVVPAGRTILVAAPLGGTLQAPADGVPQVGAIVKKGRLVFQLSPLLSAEAGTTFAASRADAEGQVNNAKTQLAVAKLALERAQRLFRDEAGSRRGVEEAQAQHDVALRSLEAAESRLKVLTQAVGDASTGRAIPIAMEAPADGMLRNLSATPGQNVPAGGPLFEVVSLSDVWVRVPIYVGDQESIELDAAAEVGGLNAKPGGSTTSAQPISAPPTANVTAATVGLYYALENTAAKYIPGQRVGVSIPLRETSDSLTVPWGAIVYDLDGGAWVYEQKVPGVYRRQRVQLKYVTEGTAVLATGPKVGTKIVTEGAEELFGAETGYSK